jgi:hypothetical protein
MALNPIVFTERVVRNFLRYQLTAYPFADERLHAQMGRLLSLDETRQSPLKQGPYISLSRPFRECASVDALVAEGLFHPHMRQRIPAEITHVYGHQEDAIRAIHAGKTTLVSTGTGSGKTECFLYPVISRCLELRDASAPAGISGVIVYPMNALAEDQLGRLRGLLAGTGIPFGMYVGKTPDREAEVAGRRLAPGSSRADDLAELEHQTHGESVHPPEEVCSREVMRTPGRQPRILLTNVKQLELLLTRQLCGDVNDWPQEREASALAVHGVLTSGEGHVPAAAGLALPYAEADQLQAGEHAVVEVQLGVSELSGRGALLIDDELDGDVCVRGVGRAILSSSGTVLWCFLHGLRNPTARSLEDVRPGVEAADQCRGPRTTSRRISMPAGEGSGRSGCSFWSARTGTSSVNASGAGEVRLRPIAPPSCRPSWSIELGCSKNGNGRYASRTELTDA